MVLVVSLLTHTDSRSVCVFPGLSSESCADVVGQPYHGHLRFAGSRHRAANRGAAAQEPVRSQQAAHFPHHDEEHPGTRRLPADRDLQPALLRSVNTPQLQYLKQTQKEILILIL